MNNELLKQRESALEKAREIYPLAYEGDYPENPTVNRLNRACVGAFMAGYDSSSRQLSESLEAYNRECKRVDELTEELEREKVKVQQYKDMVDPIIEWGQSKESNMPLGVSIMKETLRRAKRATALNL